MNSYILTLRRHSWLFVIALLTSSTCFGADDHLTASHASVSWCTLDSRHAQALADTATTARGAYVELGFDMPETVNLSVTCGNGVWSRLFNDGKDQLFLSIPSLDALAPPAKSGVFNIYGMCHELGHIAMYRTLKNRDWLSNDAAEGWAHYIGSVVVDDVYAAKGEHLWAEPYDYRQDGTARLRKEIESKSPSQVTLAAAQWQRLADIIGPNALAPLFSTWESRGIDPVRPSEALLSVIVKLHPERQTALTAWWRDAEPVLVEKVEVSEFLRQEIPATNLSGKIVEVPSSAATETSHASIGGGGEGRTFRMPDTRDWYITGVWIYGSRYGEEKAPDRQFDIALSDGDAKLISVWKRAYATFPFGHDAWVHFNIPATRVPPSFYVTFNFRADASQGVYVAYDSSTKGSSVDSVPGKPVHRFEGGDWMMRIELDHRK